VIRISRGRAISRLDRDSGPPLARTKRAGSVVSGNLIARRKQRKHENGGGAGGKQSFDYLLLARSSQIIIVSNIVLFSTSGWLAALQFHCI
jgi:hypothetical protein